MSFSTRLREKREALGLKQSELGKLLGVTGSAIGNYENGVSSPKADVLYKVFDVLKCDANFLFQDEMKEWHSFSPLTLEEEQLVTDYRDASVEIRDEAAGMLHRSAERNRKDGTLSSAG